MDKYSNFNFLACLYFTKVGGVKIKINRKVLEKLEPCKPRFKNYLKHYADFKGDLVEFLDLGKITHKDKVWVAVRLMPRFLVEVFAIDCAFSAAADAAYTATAADAAADDAAAAATYAASAADAAGVATAAYASVYTTAYYEEQRQIESLIYLITNH